MIHNKTWYPLCSLKEPIGWYPKSMKKYNFTGELQGFPDEIIDKLVERQIKAGNPSNASLFDGDCTINHREGGFDWDTTIEGDDFWENVLTYRRFDLFFERYPKGLPAKTITAAQAQEIIDSACKEWKQTLFNKWGKFVVFKDSINISDDFYKEMRKACTGPQHLLFDKIFGKDEEFAVGELVLCSHLGIADTWCIRTYTGNGICISHRLNGSEYFNWKYIAKLPEGFKLPTI